MLVDVMEALPVRDDAGVPLAEDSGVERALRSFSTAIASEDSLFRCDAPSASLVGGNLCSGDFALRFRGELEANRKVHFVLIQKLVELLRVAGSAETLAARLCLAAHPGVDAKPAGFALRLRLEARGNSAEQAVLRWGLGVAHVQQALLFTSRYLRQQVAQAGD
jgi:hypothetical protein